MRRSEEEFSLHFLQRAVEIHCNLAGVTWQDEEVERDQTFKFSPSAALALAPTISVPADPAS